MLESCLPHLQSLNQNCFKAAPSSYSPFFSPAFSTATATATATASGLLPLHSFRRHFPSPISSSSFRNRGPGRGRGRGRDSTSDYDRRPQLFKWSDIYKTISLNEDPEIATSALLNQCENQGKTFVKWELCRVVRELRKFRKYKLALEVYQWMSNRRERFQLFSSDMAIQLDLIAKAYGISSAEDFFIRIPEIQKDNRVYGALLNAYVGAKVKDKAELLMETLRSKGYLSETLPYNVMMTLYMKLKEYNKVDLLISELKQKNIPLDMYSYNIWLSARGSGDSAEKVEEVYEEMKQNDTVKPNWSTFGTLATFYIRLGMLEKAEECLKGLESKIMGRNRLPYNYLINMYGSLGNKNEVYRVWSLYKSLFYIIPNWGYHAMINSLVKVGDLEGAEKIYHEWLSVKTMHDTRITNILLSGYVNQGHFGKAEGFFGLIGETGGKPTASSWEILAVCHIRQRRIPDALNCFREAATAQASETWKPRPVNVSSFLELCEQEGDQTSKEDLVGFIRQLGFSDESYRSFMSEHVGIDIGGETKPLLGDYMSDLGHDNGEMGHESSEMMYSLAEKEWFQSNLEVETCFLANNGMPNLLGLRLKSQADLSESYSAELNLGIQRIV
ncbi:hypothetical protein V2J09_000879 [Rumex salicifolius]